MAANQRAELTTVEQVMQFYEMHSNKQYFVIYAGVSMQPNCVCYDFVDEEQPDDGIELLRQFLELIKSRPDNTNVYTIQLVDTYKEFEDKGVKLRKYSGRSLRFQLNQPQPYNSPMASKTEIMLTNPSMNHSNDEVTNMLRALLEEQKEENRKLREFMENSQNQLIEEEEEDEEDDDEEEEDELPPPSPKERINKVIAGFVERDDVQEAIAGVLINGADLLMQKFFKKGLNGNTTNEGTESN